MAIEVFAQSWIWAPRSSTREQACRPLGVLWRGGVGGTAFLPVFLSLFRLISTS